MVRPLCSWSPWPAALKNYGPCTIEALKGTLELVFTEFPHEVLKAYRASKRAIWPNSPIDVSCIGAELRVAYHFLAQDGDGNICSFAATVLSRRRRTIPLTVIWIGRRGVAEA